MPDGVPVGCVVNIKYDQDTYDVYIGRAVPAYGLPASKWGNPFKMPRGYDIFADPDGILAKYEAHVRSRPDLMAALPELRGKTMACWCKRPDREVPCHGDVLLRLIEEVTA